jgi:uncharacterized damage-inducible protein DinB
MSQAMAAELHQEAASTRKILERIPADKLTWKPHPKSMTLGQLGLHIAQIPAAIVGLAQLDGFDASHADFTPAQPASHQEIMDALDKSLPTAGDYLMNMSDETARKIWRMTAHGREMLAIPRVAVLRSILLNHWYHHRGQLSVYLRMLDVPLPVIYGRSADENPFG